MPSILSSEELRNALTYQYSQEVLEESRTKRMYNINAFNAIPREGLIFNQVERRLILHTTLNGEEISIQYPGKESAQNPSMEYDFRPKVKLANGAMMDDFTFGQIWDIFEIIGRGYRDFLSYISAIVYDMGYMRKYNRERSSYRIENIQIEDSMETVISENWYEFEWYKMGLSDDVWHTMNDRIGMIHLDDGTVVSVEAFLYMVDLLFQNEDCKYYYKKTILAHDNTYEKKLNNGRNSSSHSNLYMLNFLQGNEKVSALVNAFVKGRGVAGYRKQDYSIVTNGMVYKINAEDNE